MNRKRQGERKEVHFWLPVSMKDALEAEATSRETSVNALVVEILREWDRKRK